MSKKSISQFLMVGGVLLMLVSLGADLIGIGSYPGIFWAQWAGAGVGLAAAVAGFFVGRAKA